MGFAQQIAFFIEKKIVSNSIGGVGHGLATELLCKKPGTRGG